MKFHVIFSNKKFTFEIAFLLKLPSLNHSVNFFLIKPVIMSLEKKYRYHSKSEKFQAWTERNAGIPASHICSKYGFTERTFQRIMATPEDVIRGWENCLSKRKVVVKYEEVERYVYEKLLFYRQQGYPVSGPYLQYLATTKADEILMDMSIPLSVRQKYDGAKFEHNWLTRFNQRNKVRQIRINGERASIPTEANAQMEVCRGYIRDFGIDPSKVYNWDETGLFYRGMPQYTLAPAFDDGAGAKCDKQRVTLLVCVNGDGSHKSIKVIGKSKCPLNTSKKFWNDLGIEYYNNESAWMNQEIFTKLVVDFDKTVDEDVLLLLDNFRGHKLLPGVVLKHVKLLFFPANSTFKFQPLDCGIISSFKIYYRKHLMSYILENSASGMFRRNNLTLALCAPWISMALDQLNPKTIQKCFFKALDVDHFRVNNLENQEESDFSVLQNQVSQYFGLPVAENVVVEYLTNDDDFSEELIAQDEQETIAVPNSKKAFNNILELESYLTITQEYDALNALKAIKSVVFAHLNPQ